MSGLFHGGCVGIYTATKFAVVGIMEALRAELGQHRIGASVACPGLVSSNIFDADRNRHPRPSGAGIARDAETAARYRAFMGSGMDPLACGSDFVRTISSRNVHAAQAKCEGPTSRCETCWCETTARRRPMHAVLFVAGRNNFSLNRSRPNRLR